eukprot:8362350-Pyramimonas_sp.AAC.1
MGPYPTPPSWAACSDILDSPSVAPHDLDQAYVQFCKLFEAELKSAHNVDCLDRTYSGRANGLKLTEVSAVRTSE